MEKSSVAVKELGQKQNYLPVLMKKALIRLHTNFTSTLDRMVESLMADSDSVLIECVLG
jgi:hypothetical protein